MSRSSPTPSIVGGISLGWGFLGRCPLALGSRRGTLGRDVLENDERVDVLVARTVSTVDGLHVAFSDVWSRRRAIEIALGVRVAIPSLDDLILTKRFGARPKDAEDLRLLEVLRSRDPQ